MIEDHGQETTSRVADRAVFLPELPSMHVFVATGATLELQGTIMALVVTLGTLHLLVLLLQREPGLSMVESGRHEVIDIVAGHAVFLPELPSMHVFVATGATLELQGTIMALVVTFGTLHLSMLPLQREP